MQNGYIFKHGRQWWLRYRETVIVDGRQERRRVNVVLAPVCDQYRVKSNVRKLADEILCKLPGQMPKTIETVAHYIEHVFLKHVEATMRASTWRSYFDQFQLVKAQPFFAGLRLYAVTTADVHQFLAAVVNTPKKDGQPRAQQSLHNLRGFLSNVFRYAVNQGRLTLNPVKLSITPDTGAEEEETHAYTLDEVHAILAVLDEPAKTMCLAAALTGLRVSELAALKWEDFTGSSLIVRRAYVAGKVDETKTARSKAEIPLLPILADALEEHKARNGTSDWVFHGTRANKPIQAESLAAKHIRPVLKAHGVEWHGWHAFRRGIASNLYELGAPDKTVQAILRHADVMTTMRHYVKARPEATAAAMTKLSEAFSEAGNARRTA